MKYASLVARREYVENAKTKGFWISLFLFPAIIFLMFQVPIWLEEKATPVRYFVLVDQSGTLLPVIEPALERSHQRRVLDALKEYVGKNLSAGTKSAAEKGAVHLPPGLIVDDQWVLDTFISQGGKEVFLRQIQPHLKPGAPAFKEPRRSFQQVKLPAGINADTDLPTLSQALKPYLRGDRRIEVDGHLAELNAAVLIPRDIEKQIVRPQAGLGSRAAGANGIEFWSANVTPMKGGGGLRYEIEQVVNAEVRRREYVAKGMDSAAIRQVERTYAPFASLNPKKETGKEAVDTGDIIKQWAPSACVYLLWVAIFSIVQMLLGNIIEEKSNRIIEVLLSSVTPGELMMGKLFGIAAIGLTMVGVWIGSLFGILAWKGGGASAEITNQVMTVLKTTNLLPVFGIYFVLGYLMYSAIILSLGSVCNTLKDAQNYMGVITMVMMVPLMTMTYIPTDPNGVTARVLSWIPIYTPFAMMNRATADPPLVDLIGTMILLLVTTCTALWMAGKIFRIGILRTGQPPRILEMLRWVKG
jgi:ABC-2 type transport system permease protein